jgi:hypothetical protein
MARPQTGRPRFYLALDRVAREAAFDPEEMGDYLRAKLGLPSGDDHDDTAVARVTDAWAVRDFLVITGAANIWCSFALEAAGAEFTNENGGGAGVRLLVGGCLPISIAWVIG